jgi:ACS family D-galactonate transporter-like MFS transporter
MSNPGPVSATASAPAPVPVTARPLVDDAPAPARLTAARCWTIVGLLCFAMMAAYFVRQAPAHAIQLPSFKRLFGLDEFENGVFLSAFYYSYALLQIPAGWVVDRFGVKRSLAVGFVFWSLAAACTGVATSFFTLCGFRVLLGIGEAVLTPGAMRWIRFNVPEERRGTAVGFFMASAKVGPAVAALLATWLAEKYGWKMMFAVLGLGCLVWLLPWQAAVRDDDRAIEQRQRKASNVAPVAFGTVLRSPVIWGTLVGTFAYQYFLYFCMTWLPSYFQNQRHLSFKSSGWFTGFSLGGMAIVAISAGFLADYLIARGRDAVNVRRTFCMLGLILASTEMVGAFSSSLNVALFFAIFSLAGLGLMTANYWALTQTLLPGGAVGRIVGLQNMAANIPGIVAPMATGWLVKKTGSYAPPMVIAGALLFLGLASYLFVVRRQAPAAAAARA